MAEVVTKAQPGATVVQIGRQAKWSSTQRTLLAAQLRRPASIAQNMALFVRFDVDVDVDRLVVAFETVVQSSDVLRTRVASGTSDPLVAPKSTSATSIEYLDGEEVLAWARRMASEPLDLVESVYRSAIAVEVSGAVSWVINIHHIATDAASSALVVEQTIDAYLGVQPSGDSFYDWARQCDLSASESAAAAHWALRDGRGRVGGVYQSVERSTGAAQHVPIALDAARLASIEDRFAGAYRMLTPDLSWVALLVTSASVYLHQLTGATAFTIGLPVHHRSSPETRLLVGPLMGLYPVDIEIAPGSSLRETHSGIARSVLDALRGVRAGVRPHSDFDVVVNVLKAEVPAMRAEMPIRVEWLRLGEIDDEHVLRVQLTHYSPSADGPAQPQLHLDVLEEAMSGVTPVAVAQHFDTVLQKLIDEPDLPVAGWPISAPVELDRIVGAERTPDFDVEPVLVGERLRSVLEGAHHVVLEQGDRTVSADELWQWSMNVAADIERTERADARIGIEMSNSIETVVALFGVMLAGRSFVPLDPDQPEGRRKELAVRAGIRRSFRSADDVVPFAQRLPHQFLPAAPAPSAEAYLLFTSGSTGEPKGVPITQRGLARYIEFAASSYFDGDRSPVAALFTALTFDLTITTLFAPILRGGRLVPITASGSGAVAELASLEQVTWCKATPSHLAVFLALVGDGHSLSTVVVGGEAFGAELAERLFDFNPKLRVFNEYGPTEAVVGCMIHEARPESLADRSAVPIGVPATGVELRVVAGAGQRVPIGVPGELLISHPGLTSGYLGVRSGEGHGAKGERDPFVEIDGRRFYRSGDLVVRTSDLDLVYLGRIDDQIKVGGVRLDPVEVEQALAAHPAVESAAVRLWTPSDVPASQHCTRCGLPDNVPDTVFDSAGVCQICHAFDTVAPIAASWWRSPEELGSEIREQRAEQAGTYDCLHLLSGGKDSTYALYQLVELGLRPYTLTLDNGFISEAAKDNARRATKHLGLEHEFVSTDAMLDIFRDSLETYSDVCHGCYKTIYTLAANRAVELGIPTIVTGLSRGQLFETRLIPGQFQADRFDPDAIDQAVIEARKRYHRAPDVPNRLLDTAIFEQDDLFDRLRFIDFYRYFDVELDDVLTYLAEHTTWTRPADTGRSSNCLINVAGIRAHQIEKGYHNYAEPYAWDVRLGHKERDQSIAELDDPIDDEEIAEMLQLVGYEPAPKSLLTGWVTVAPGAAAPTPIDLRRHLEELLPTALIPSAFVVTEELVTNRNGKLDVERLPAPNMRHRAAAGAQIDPESDLEAEIIAVWESVLGMTPIGPHDDFFLIGGDSLDAVSMVVRLGDTLGVALHEGVAFSQTTPRLLAQAIADTVAGSDRQGRRLRSTPVPSRLQDEPPELLDGERSILMHQATQPGSVLYNVARMYHVDGAVDAATLIAAAHTVAALHEPLSWSFANPRVPLEPEAAVVGFVADDIVPRDVMARRVADLQRRPFDLDRGPLLRVLVQQVDDGSTTVALIVHHVSGDHQSLDSLWGDIDRSVHGRTIEDFDYGMADLGVWQRSRHEEAQHAWSEVADFAGTPEFHSFGTAPAPQADGYLECRGRISSAELRNVESYSPVAAVVAAAAAATRQFFTASRVEVSLVASTRTDPAADRLVGYLLNPMPLVFDCPRDRSIGDLVIDASVSVGRLLSVRDYPFAKIVEDRRAAGRVAPTGRILVSYSDDPAVTYGGRKVRQEMSFNGHAVADLAFFVEPGEETVSLGLEYNGSTVGGELAAVILSVFDAALHAAIHAPSGAVAAPEIVGRDAVSVLIGAPLDSAPLLVDEVLRHVAEQPASLAVEFDGLLLTWSDLGARAAQLADALRDRGVGPGDRVAIRLGRSAEIPVAVVGVLLCGAAYVPVDPTYPEDRVAASIELSGAAVEIVSGANGSDRVTQLELNADGIDGRPWATVTPTSISHDATMDTEAYVIFTSGSSGTPNGVAITHRQLAASTGARRQFYDAGPERFLLLSSIAFDSSIVGLFWTLASGGAIVLPNEDVVHDIDALAGLFGTSRATHVLTVPTLYSAVLSRKIAAQGWPNHVIVAGEACPADLVVAHGATVPSSRLYNEYGPTEATVWCTAHECRPGPGVVPIGQPIAGVWVAVVDAQLQPTSIGEPGELIIGGPNVVRGYLDGAPQPKFADVGDFAGLDDDLPGPVVRSGDKVSIVNGGVVFHGRVDDQLNVGGVRVEPTDIEQTISLHSDVTSVVVTAVDVRPSDEILVSLSDDDVLRLIESAAASASPATALLAELRASGAQQRLVAHVVGSPGLDATALRQHIADRLPTTHRPSIILIQNSLPTLPNGKLDRAAVRALPVAGETTPPRTTSSPDGAASPTVVAEMFAEVFVSGEVDVDTSFFDLGGSSLVALELINRIEDRFGVRLPASAVHRHPTPAALSAVLADSATDTSATDNTIVVDIQPLGSKPPIFALHILGTNGSLWQPLSGLLGIDQPMYGVGDPFALLNPFSTHYDVDADPDIVGTAQRYVRHITAVAPDGPVVLIGVCLGGVVAYEVAQQLTALGRKVVNVVTVLDWHAPHIEYQESLANRVRTGSRTSGTSGFAYVLGVLRRGKFVKRTRRRAEIFGVEVLNRLHLPLTRRLRLREYIEDGKRRIHEYVYEPYAGRVTIVRSTDDPRIPPETGSLGWGDLLDELAVEWSTGLGNGMLGEPHVHGLAAVLQRALRGELDYAPSSAGVSAIRNS